MTRLNLVGALDALLGERSVSRAARRAGVTQSGMSHALSTLRELLGDDLLVRSGNRMEPTPRAARMAPGIRRGLAEIQQALAGEEPFVPERSERTLRIGTTDAATVLLVAPLIERLLTRAPRLRFDVVPLHRGDPAAALEIGELDLLITAQIPERPGLSRAAVHRDRFVCLLRKGHPALGRRLTLDRWLALDHILITTTGQGQSVIERDLEALGRTRRIAVRLGYFAAAPLLVARSNLVVTMPSGTAAVLARGHAVVTRPCPLQPEAGPLCVVWHERYRNDPAVKWLRGEITAVGRALSR